jgi:hypothetical protein
MTRKTGGPLVHVDAGRNTRLVRLENSGPNAELGRPGPVVTDELFEDQSQVPIVNWNQIIETFAPDGFDEPSTIVLGFGREPVFWSADA